MFLSGEDRDVEAVRPVLETIGSELVPLGAPGSAATAKLILNLLLGAQVASLAEAVTYGERAASTGTACSPPSRAAASAPR